MSTLIFILWGLAIAAEISLLGVLMRQRLLNAYPGVTCWAIISAASGLHLAYAHIAHNAYAATWREWQPWALAALIAITIDVARSIGGQWPARRLAVAVNVIFGGLALAAMGWVARILPAHQWGIDAPLIRLSEHFALACAVTIGANWLIYSIPQVEWRKNTRRHARAALILTVCVGGGLAIAAASKSYASVAVANLLLGAAPIVACVIWGRMTRKGEEFAGPVPQNGLLEALEGQDRKRIGRDED